MNRGFKGPLSLCKAVNVFYYWLGKQLQHFWVYINVSFSTAENYPTLMFIVLL